jgi:AhpD family alkylhydroperoxidase
MPFIETVGPAEAEGALAEIYRRIAGARGAVAAVHQVQALNPAALEAHFELYKAIMFQPSPLGRATREAIAVAVSEANGCAYCVAHHREALDRLGGGARDPALLEWARRLARSPESASAADIEALRRLGLTDRAILDAILTVAYFSYVNRLVLATGLELEPDYRATCGSEPGA